MRRLLSVGLLLGWLSGCLGARPLTEPMGPPVPIYSDNPLLIPLADPQMVWEGVVDVVDDYFKIEREEPVRLFGDTLTEGRLDTFHEVGTTWLEPWRYDSADGYERLESTLQSIRRRAQVRVIPAQVGDQRDGFLAVEGEVEHYHLRAQPGDCLQRRRGVPGLADHEEVRLAGQQEVQTLAHDRVIVDEQQGCPVSH